MEKSESATTPSEERKGSEIKISPQRCPICGIATVLAHAIHESKIKEDAVWYQCQCGVIFQEKQPDHTDYNKEYTINYAGAKEYNLRVIHAPRIYAPLIEELTYGRMMLDVGFNTSDVMDFFENRGWIPWGIDLNESSTYGGNLYKGSFEDYDFSIKLSKKAKEMVGNQRIDRQFDLIWMNHVFEHFRNPIKALKKAYDLLPEAGMLYIATPDIDFITKLTSPGFPHWKKREHYIMWSERALRRELERIGFKVIVSRRNFASRFISWFDVQILAQKPYF